MVVAAVPAIYLGNIAHAKMSQQTFEVAVWFMLVMAVAGLLRFPGWAMGVAVGVLRRADPAK